MSSEHDELKAELALLRAAIAGLTGAKPPASPITLNQVAEWYGRRVGQRIMYTLVPLLAALGERQVSSLRKADYLHFRDEHAATPSKRKGKRAVGTLNQVLRQTHAMLRAAKAAELVDANPFEGVAYLKGQRPRETVIDLQEHAAATADAPLLVRVFQLTCLETGARNGCEVRLMEWSHIDRVGSAIALPRENAKGKTRARVVPVSDYLIGQLESLPRVLGSPYIFANPTTRQPYSRVHLNRLCRPYLDRLTPAKGDGKVVMHDGRHTRVSAFVAGGLDVFASMKIVGHQTVAMHWRYHHVSPADRKKAKDILEAERPSRR